LLRTSHKKKEGDYLKLRYLLNTNRRCKPLSELYPTMDALTEKERKKREKKRGRSDGVHRSTVWRDRTPLARQVLASPREHLRRRGGRREKKKRKKEKKGSHGRTFYEGVFGLMWGGSATFVRLREKKGGGERREESEAASSGLQRLGKKLKPPPRGGKKKKKKKITIR